MYIQELQKTWHTYGLDDPLWAVCTEPDKQNNKWDHEEFFSTGRKKIEHLAEWMAAHDLPRARGNALDFGCGVGRLTQSLCEHFKQCIGVDIAPSMIAKAKELNRHGIRCVYRLNETGDLRAFRSSSFDLVYTEHVLQHMHPNLALRYIAEFIRILRPGGLAMFHCPSAKATFAYPEQGFHCTLHTSCNAIDMESGSKMAVPMELVNTGQHPIAVNQKYNTPVHIAQHWYCHATRTSLPFQSQVRLPHDTVDPGESLQFECIVSAPKRAGEYTLVFEPYTATRKSIARNESEFLMMKATVHGNARQENDAEGAAAERQPKMEMNYIPEETVQQNVEAAGGFVVDVETSQTRPGAWVQSRYYVTRK